MTRRRRLAIAAQAVVVAVLVAVVYVTLLQPDDGGDLSGVQAPGGGRAALPAPGGKGERPDRARRNPRPGPRTAIAAGSFGGGAGGPYGYRGTGSKNPGGAGALVSTPSDHQYGDAVGELLKQLGD